jgi:MFS family permease
MTNTQQGRPEDAMPNTRVSVPGQRVALAVMAVVLVLSMTTWFSTSAIIPQLRTQWSLGTNEASLLIIAVQLGFVVGAVISATLNITDVFPAPRILWISALGAALANAAIVFAHGPAAALPLRFLTGVCLAGVYPTSLKIMSTWFERGRGTALGIMIGALTIGSAAPHLVNGAGGLGWRQVIVATSVLTAAGGVLALAAVRDGPFPFPRARFDVRQVGNVFANRGVRLASIGYFGHMWELYAMWAWFLAFMTDELARRGHPSHQAAALATFAVIGVGGVGCWIGGVLGDSWGRTRTTAAAMAISGTCGVLAGAVYGGPVALVLVVGVVWGLTVVADSAQFSTIVTELADRSYVGTALTLQLAVGFTLTVVTIWLVPVLRDSLGWRWTFAFLSPGPAVGIVAMLRLLRLPEHELIAGGRG